VLNSLPKTATRQRRDCDLNPRPAAPESSTLTTRLPSHRRREHGIQQKRLDMGMGMRTRTVGTGWPVPINHVVDVANATGLRPQGPPEVEKIFSARQ